MTEYPPDWVVIELSDVGTWMSGGTPPTGNPAYWGGEIPWISATSLKSFDISDSERKVTELGAISGTRRVPSGTVIFIVRGMSLKTEFRVGVTSRDVTFGQDCKAIDTPAGVSSKFLAYALKAKESEVLAMVDEAGHGTGRLPSTQLAQLRIGFPDEHQQNKIVDLLDSVDESIRSTERLVAKLTRFRQGLIQQLLESGTSPLVASGWITRSVEQLGEVRLGRQRSPQSEAGSFMKPYLRVANVFDGRIDFSDVLEMNFTPNEQAIYAVRNGDLLLNEGQSLDLVGRCAKYEGADGLFCFQNTLIRYRCSKLLDPDFAYYVFSHWLRTGRFADIAKQTTSIAHLGADRFAKMQMVIPPILEQRRIVSALKSVDESIRSTGQLIDKLEQSKAGLMDDLLTGRVRVPAGEDIAV